MFNYVAGSLLAKEVKFDEDLNRLYWNDGEKTYALYLQNCIKNVEVIKTEDPDAVSNALTGYLIGSAIKGSGSKFALGMAAGAAASAESKSHVKVECSGGISFIAEVGPSILNRFFEFMYNTNADGLNCGPLEIKPGYSFTPQSGETVRISKPCLISKGAISLAGRLTLTSNRFVFVSDDQRIIEDMPISRIKMLRYVDSTLLIQDDNVSFAANCSKFGTLVELEIYRILRDVEKCGVIIEPPLEDVEKKIVKLVKKVPSKKKVVFKYIVGFAGTIWVASLFEYHWIARIVLSVLAGIIYLFWLKAETLVE